MSKWVRIFVQVVKITLEVPIGEEDGTAKNQDYPWPTVVPYSLPHFHIFTLPSYVSVRHCQYSTSAVDPDLHESALV